MTVTGFKRTNCTKARLAVVPVSSSLGNTAHVTFSHYTQLLEGGLAVNPS